MTNKFTRPLAQNSQFRFFSTCSPEMLFNGIDVELDTSFNQKKCKEYLKTIIQSMIKDIQQFDLLIYLPGGIPFTNGTLNDVFSNYSDPKVKHYIYGILTRPISDYYLDHVCLRLCDISTPEKKLLLSPIYDSTDNGLCNISCLLGCFNKGSNLSDAFLKKISSVIPFPPFTTSFIRLMETDTPVTGRDIVTITSTLHTYFSHLINMSKPPDQVFNYALQICSNIMKGNQPPYLPIQNMIFAEEKLTPNFWPLTVLKGSIYKNIYFWKGDLYDSEDDYSLIKRIDIDQIDNEKPSCFSFTSNKGYSIVEGRDHCYLFFSQRGMRQGMCTVIDPMTGVNWMFPSFEDCRYKFKDIKFDLNSYKKESIKQMVYICFNKSLSSSLTACQYLDDFVKNSFEYDVSCVQGLIQFSTNSKIDSHLNPPFQSDFIRMMRSSPSKGSANGNCYLDSICLAIDELERDQNEFKKAVRRIVVFSNGKKDVHSKMSLKETACKLLNSKVTLDSVVFDETADSKELITLCHITGGYSFNLDTLEKGFHLFDKPSFLDIEKRRLNSVMLIEGDRRTKPTFLTPSVLTDEFIQKAIGMAKFDTDVVNCLLDKVLRERNLATPRHVCCVNRKNTIPESRRRRILRELHCAMEYMDENYEFYDPNIVVLPLRSMLDIWQVFLRGTEKTPYEGKWFRISVSFPDLYPVEPPAFQFISIPYHMNISFEGRICHELLNQSYEPSLHIIEIIQCLKEIFIIPHIECPLRIDAYETYKDTGFYHEQYFAEAKKSAEIVGKDDYHEFLNEHSKIYDDVDADFKCEIDDEIPPYMMSQISGKSIDPEKIVMASTGVYYDRDELIQLIRSNEHPICVITGKPLTDKLEDLEDIL